LERFPEQAETTAKTESSATEESPLERPKEPVPVFKPAQEENVPVIIPEKQPEESAPDIPGISAGIAGMVRGFGYKGEIEVPENFKRRVAYYIRYFSGSETGSRFYRRAMNRGSQYLPMIRSALKRKKLPLSLAYLPVIESGFNPTARSRASAVGMWQFMRGTARMYGLRVNRRVDERKDPIKSTIAAAEYLNDLLSMFGAEDPFLGISAFNAGEGKIFRALRKISYKERSFWTLVKKDLLRTETNQYIPRLLAVVLMAKDPARYAAASKAVPLELESETASTEDEEVIGSLLSSKDNLGEKPQTPAEVRKVQAPQPRVSTYRVRRGDTLFSIAKKFRVYVRSIKKWNRLRSNRIYAGQRLKIYKKAGAAAGKVASKTSSRGYRLVYTVNYTDSLARIALFFKGVTARDIMKWNRLRRTRIYPKQKLALYLKQRPRKILTHIIKRGDTARKIARRYKLRIEYVLSLNGLVTSSRLKPGKRLKIYYF
jgi:membrane-bound lytic murein transglycosylase D